jgi:hypothetical protein
MAREVERVGGGDSMLDPAASGKKRMAMWFLHVYAGAFFFKAGYKERVQSTTQSEQKNL